MARLKRFLHGECIVTEVTSIPSDAKKITVRANHFVIGDSETTGNDHRVAVLDKTKVEFFEKDGILYMKNTIETDVFCPNERRHGRMTVPPSIWRINKAQEFDYVEMQARDVKD